MSDIYKLYDEVATNGNLPQEWVDKMIHKVPEAPVFDRAEYLVKACTGKVILDVGASGPMSEKLAEVAKEYHAVGIDENPGFENYHQIDLEVDNYPPFKDYDLIIAGEILEHLSNAGHFLDLIRQYKTQVIITVPNAYSIAGWKYMSRGIEAVNKEHVAWYSYHTLKVLVERHGFKILLWAWYNGKPLTAEGLIFHLESDYGKS